ncbi:sugar phosphate isomerase/epimerase [Paenibacillus mucilaginosus]|uniref:sugar phosphate isomerase/epimerase family protein n=1 Tax=Paenibacillus mucilaginosus TaxID=61624 RepID=UPI003D2351DA
MNSSVPNPYDAFSFSTSWNVKRHAVGRDMIDEIRGLGFRRIELNYQVTAQHLETIEPMIESGLIEISSVHHVFPRTDDPEFGPDSLMLGHPDEAMRRQGVELLVQSAEYATRYGAKAVVLHPGEADIGPQFDAELKRLYREGLRESEAYADTWRRMLARRTEAAAPALRHMRDSLETVCDRLAVRGIHVAIGLETRARCHQLPTPAEAAEVIAGLAGAPVYLWVDSGHAIIMERMGLYDNTVDMVKYRRLIYGMHIHDTVGLVDHGCPYVHTQDVPGFERFLPAIAAAELKVYELKPNCTPEEIRISVQTLAARLQALQEGAGV